MVAPTFWESASSMDQQTKTTWNAKLLSRNWTLSKHVKNNLLLSQLTMKNMFHLKCESSKVQKWWTTSPNSTWQPGPGGARANASQHTLYKVFIAKKTWSLLCSKLYDALFEAYQQNIESLRWTPFWGWKKLDICQFELPVESDWLWLAPYIKQDSRIPSETDQIPLICASFFCRDAISSHPKPRVLRRVFLGRAVCRI